ncbi:MAG: DNA mismatch repair endonuclease MutL [Clostridia bacterium]|nr:DNA mismatch repair endonuclease MutL [Clostridia bacterium]
MAKINVLDSSIYNRIAAGEVVERPASVVKELVENSIDAGATSIIVEIEYGGIRKIKIVDNGCGVEKEYMREAFMPHATSKISSADDLDSIMTLGFRGEALASIASVCHVTMTSKTRDAELGSFIEIEAGKILKMSETGARDGTTMVVSDLFFNVPARAKFLKKPKSEEQEVTNLVSRLMLANPQISFRYIVDGKTIFVTSGKTLKEAMFGVYGKEVLTETLEVKLARDGVKLWGFVGRPSFSKPNRTYQTLMVNGRYVTDQMVSLAVMNAYGDMLMKRKYPFFVLNLELPFTDVDANVHPNKREVRFAYGQKIYSLVFEAVSRALHDMDYVASVARGGLDEDEASVKEEIKASIYKAAGDNSEIKISLPKITVPNTEPKSAPKIDKAGVNLSMFASSFSSSKFKGIQDDDEKEVALLKNNVVAYEAGGTKEKERENSGFGLGSKLMDGLGTKMSGQVQNTPEQGLNSQQENKSQAMVETISRGTTKLVGKAFNTYLIVEIDDDIFFIDQHAAHERILYEKFKRQVDAGAVAIQPLLLPFVLNLSSNEAEILEINLETMREIGFEIDEFGNSSFKVSAIPSILSDINFDEFFFGFLSETKQQFSKSDLIKEKLMQHSCKSAIKGGNDITISEIDKLFENMSAEKIPLFCPHGRPIAVRVKKTEVEKWFKRIV